MQTRAASTMLLATHLAVVVLAATAATAASSVLSGAPDLPVSPPNPLNVISSLETASTTIFAHPPSLSATPTVPIGMRRMLDHGYPFSSAPTALPSASPPVALPELTNSERLALGLPVRPPRLRRVLPGSLLDSLDKDALLPRPSSVPKKRHGPSMLPLAVLPTARPVRLAPTGLVAPVIGSIDGLVKYCAVSGTCQTAKAKSGGEGDW